MRIYLLFILLLGSCTLQKETTKDEASIQQDKKSEIVFLVLKISRDSIQKKNEIDLVNITKSTGSFKKQNQTDTRYDNYLTVEVYEEDKLASSFTLEHPLFKRVEYSDGDSLTSKSIELEKQEFFIRVQTKGMSNRALIYETLKNRNTQKLTEIKL